MLSTPARPTKVGTVIATVTLLALSRCGEPQDGDASETETTTSALTAAAPAQVGTLSAADVTAVYPNGSGSHQTFSSTGNVATAGNPFFQSLGTNGRACVSCHQPAAAWGITPSQVQQV